jgi:hypothetical protein
LLGDPVGSHHVQGLCEPARIGCDVHEFGKHLGRDRQEIAGCCESGHVVASGDVIRVLQEFGCHKEALSSP